MDGGDFCRSPGCGAAIDIFPPTILPPIRVSARGFLKLGFETGVVDGISSLLKRRHYWQRDTPSQKQTKSRRR
ncbi:hypothetical protein TNIN_212641 [Trichonephila inaurata madagascariensis]|uniref:Uncharacterized protein n=1 Tax=Trichonephila inaurata madagascariensis TaxID=2747483 RepID=A0A8X6WUJ0_9ARAC|nr:hypothetical protein TNIN_212641 [Trichonephila inaurata madagascariensis]